MSPLKTLQASRIPLDTAGSSSATTPAEPGCAAPASGSQRITDGLKILDQRYGPLTDEDREEALRSDDGHSVWWHIDREMAGVYVGAWSFAIYYGQRPSKPEWHRNATCCKLWLWFWPFELMRAWKDDAEYERYLPEEAAE